MSAKIRVAPAIVLSHYFETRRADFKSAMAAAGISESDLSSHRNLIPLAAFTRLLQWVQQEPGGDTALTRLTASVATSSIGLVGHLALAAPTVRVYLQCLAGFAPLLVTSVEVGFEEAGGVGRFYWRMPSEVGVPHDLAALFCVSAVVERVRSLSPPGWYPSFVEFEHKAPPNAEALAGLFGRRLAFNALRTSIGFDMTTLARAMPSANVELFEIYLDHAVTLMREQVGEDDILARTSAAITAAMGRGYVGLDAVAYELKTSKRALQRRLELAGTSFDQVLDKVRRASAERLLRDTDRPFQQIAFDLGYRSQSAFTRAVRRWLLQSPRDYRQNCRQGNQPSN